MLPSDFSPERKARQRYLKWQADLRESIRVVDAQPPLPVNGWRVSLLFDNEKAKEMPFINAARKLKWNPDAIIERSGKVRITVTLKKAKSAAEAVLMATKLLPTLIETAIEVETTCLDERKVRIQGERYTLGIISGVMNVQTEVMAEIAFQKSKPRSAHAANSFLVVDDLRLSAIVEIGGVKNEAEAIKMTRKLLASVGITESVEISGLTGLDEVKVKVSTEPFFTVEVQFDKEDFGNILDRKAGTLTDSFVDTFARILSVGRFEIEERLRERRMFIKVAAKSSKEAIKIVNTFLVQARKVHAGAR